MRLFLGLIFSFFFASVALSQTSTKDIVQESGSAKSQLPMIDSILGLKVDSIETGLNFLTSRSYLRTKLYMTSLQQEFQLKYSLAADSSSQKSILDSAGSVFTEEILNSLFPFWYGTQFGIASFGVGEDTTDPNLGRIGWRSFILTCMKDMGLKLNMDEFKKLTVEEFVGSFAIDRNNMLFLSSTDFLVKIDEMEDGLYLVNDAFLYKWNKKAFFIHSSMSDKMVVIEDVEHSSLLKSKGFFIVGISNNITLMKMWVNGVNLPPLK